MRSRRERRRVEYVRPGVTLLQVTGRTDRHAQSGRGN